MHHIRRNKKSRLILTDFSAILKNKLYTALHAENKMALKLTSFWFFTLKIQMNISTPFFIPFLQKVLFFYELIHPSDNGKQ